MKEHVRYLLPEVKKAMEEYCGYSHKHAEIAARELLTTMPDVLLPNLYEWLKGEPISDLRVGKYSIYVIMKIWNLNEKKEFPLAAETMSLYIREPRSGERRIWRMWR